MFTPEKVSQLAAYFLGKTQGTSMAHLKLMKLLYIADREAVRKLGYSMSDDSHVSMAFGPVLSEVYDLIQGRSSTLLQGKWDGVIERISEYDVRLSNVASEFEFDEVSAAEIEILDDVWNQFGDFDKYQLAEWTHASCSEWIDPGNSSISISIEEIAIAVGLPEEVAHQLAKESRERAIFERALLEE